MCSAVPEMIMHADGMTRLGAILALCGALGAVMPAVSWLPVTVAIPISAMFGWL